MRALRRRASGRPAQAPARPGILAPGDQRSAAGLRRRRGRSRRGGVGAAVQTTAPTCGMLTPRPAAFPALDRGVARESRYKPSADIWPAVLPFGQQHCPAGKLHDGARQRLPVPTGVQNGVRTPLVAMTPFYDQTCPSEAANGPGGVEAGGIADAVPREQKIAPAVLPAVNARRFITRATMHGSRQRRVRSPAKHPAAKLDASAASRWCVASRPSAADTKRCAGV